MRVLLYIILGALFVAPTAGVAQDSLPPVEIRQERLDDLFAQLAKSTAQEAVELQEEITAIWNETDSDGMNFIFMRARDALGAGKLEIAVDHLDDLIELRPDFAEGWNARATAHYYLRNYNQSFHDIREALAREPRHFGALVGLGLVYTAVGDYRNALNVYRAALALHPHLPGPKRMIPMLEERLQREKGI